MAYSTVFGNPQKAGQALPKVVPAPVPVQGRCRVGHNQGNTAVPHVNQATTQHTRGGGGGARARPCLPCLAGRASCGQSVRRRRLLPRATGPMCPSWPQWLLVKQAALKLCFCQCGFHNAQGAYGCCLCCCHVAGSPHSPPNTQSLIGQTRTCCRHTLHASVHIHAPTASGWPAGPP
jgi:hypothetical protein